MSYPGRRQFITYRQATPYASPWTWLQRIYIFFWQLTWGLLCSWTPKPFNRWRIFWLKLFGARIHGKPFVHQRARIAIPWNLTMHHHACLGDGSVAYSLGRIEIMDDATVAQEAYLCTGTHDFESSARELQTGGILIGYSAFVGARAFVLPGIQIGDGAVIGVCSVVTKDIAPHAIAAGNPALVIGRIGDFE